MTRLDLSVYLVTDTALCGARGVPDTVRMAIAGGATVIQVRDHDATTRELVALTLAVIDVARPAGIPVLVDDRVDVAVVTGADGAHVGQSDLAPIDARSLLGADAIVGLSVTTLDQVRDADALPVGVLDYLGVGPLHATATKPGHPTPLGLDGARELVTAAALPTVVIGGVKVDHVAAVRAIGADGVAVVSAICAADDPTTAAAQFRDAWRQG